jgi:hypothetical protein
LDITQIRFGWTTVHIRGESLAIEKQSKGKIGFVYGSIGRAVHNFVNLMKKGTLQGVVVK